MKVLRAVAALDGISHELHEAINDKLDALKKRS